MEGLKGPRSAGRGSVIGLGWVNEGLSECLEMWRAAEAPLIPGGAANYAHDLLTSSSWDCGFGKMSAQMAADAAELTSRINRRFSKIVASGVGMSVEPRCCSLLPNTSPFGALSLLLLASPPPSLSPPPDRAGTKIMRIILIAQGSCLGN